MRRSTPRRGQIVGAQAARISLRDVLSDVCLSIVSRPGRAALTMAGTIVGVGALVATVALSTTIAHQVSGDFDEIAATEVIVRDSRPGSFGGPFEGDLRSRLSQLRGIRQGGVLWSIESVAVAAVPLTSEDGAEHAPLIAADPGALKALLPTVRSGRLYDESHAEHGADVVVLGAILAERVLPRGPDGATVVFVNGWPLTVIAVLDDVGRRPEALLSVIVPRATASRRLALQGSAEVLIDTRPGAAALVAAQAPTALSPFDPARLTAISPPDFATLRRSVEGRLQSLLLALGTISLIVGAMGIANSTLVSVLERTPELGLRRALGATPRHLVVGVIAEAGALGGVGGLVGTSTGVLIVVGIAFTREWQVVADSWLLVVGPLLGVVAGILAGVLPALRARQIQPVEALQR